jgi:GST-like protein
VIDLYTWFTPNGRKVSLMLEECGLDYTTHAINIGKDDQFAPDFLKISPNNKIPAIFDNDNGKSLMESGAIMMYLADKSGKFWPQDPDDKWSTVEWLMSCVKRLIVSMGCKVGGVTLYRKASHPVSQF